MKMRYYLPLMGIAAGLLIFALINTNYNDPLGPLVFEAAVNEPNNAPLLGPTLSDIDPQISFLSKDQIGDFKFKLSSEQLAKLDCSVIGPGTETYIVINGELYVFECPEGNK